MNKFLTKEQAEYLIEQLCKTNRRQATECGALVEIQRAEDIKEIISQCTEQKFPTFAVNMDNCAISIDLWCKYYIKVWLELSEPAFTFENFKVFTDGCQRIVEWIENNEK